MLSLWVKNRQGISGMAGLCPVMFRASAPVARWVGWDHPQEASITCLAASATSAGLLVATPPVTLHVDEWGLPHSMEARFKEWISQESKMEGIFLA